MKSQTTILRFLIILGALTSCSKPLPVNGVKATATRVELTISSVTAGTVTAEREAELSFGTVGRVAKNMVHVGDQVEANQILAELENIDLATNVRTSLSDFERAQGLVRTKALSPQQLDVYERSLNLAQANYEKSLIRAPFAGLITQVNLEIGQLSQITAVIPKPLVKIVDLNPRFIKTQIDEVDLPKLKLGQPARIKILAIRREPFTGTIRRIVPYVSTIREQDRTSEIEITIDSGGLLLPVGASADVEVIAAEAENVLSLPARVVLGRSDDRYVFVADGKTARKQSVTLGLGNYDRVQINQGISSGDVILYPSETADLTDGQSVNVTVLPWP